MESGIKLNSEVEVLKSSSDQLVIVGGCTVGIFPSIKKWFDESAAHRAAMAAVLGDESLKHYQSLTDCVVAEVFKDLRPWVLKFYRGEGPIMSDLVSRRDAIRIESVLLQCLAYSIILDQAKNQGVKLPRGWRAFSEEARRQVFGD